MSVGVCCALLRFGGADLGGDLEYLQTRERSVHKRTHAPSASIGCDDPGCGWFPSAPVEWRSRKRSEAVASRLGSTRIAAMVHSQPRKRHAKACASTAWQNAGTSCVHTSTKMPAAVYIMCNAHDCCAN